MSTQTDPVAAARAVYNELIAARDAAKVRADKYALIALGHTPSADEWSAGAVSSRVDVDMMIREGHEDRTQLGLGIARALDALKVALVNRELGIEA